MKILFAFNPLFVRYNHGIALLSALCKRRGIEVGLAILDDQEMFLAQIGDFSPDVVGFSCVTRHDYEAARPYMRLAKECGRAVLLGGVWAGLGHPVDACVDLVCRGDGETLPALLTHGDLHAFTAQRVFTDIDLLPLPDYELFADVPFDRGVPYLDDKQVLPYFSSRGCVGSCSFCQVRHQPRGMRIRRRVAEDLAGLKSRYNPDVFFIGDACLPYFDMKWRESWGDFRHPFAAYIRADIRPEWLSWLIDRGMIGCAFGVESGDEHYRQNVLRKDLTDDALWRTVDVLDRHGVEYHAFFMAGTPGEGEREAVATRDMVEQFGERAICFQYENLMEQ